MSDTHAHRAPLLVSVCVLVVAAAAPVARIGGAPAAHDAAFWQAIVDADYRLPPGQSAGRLVDELIGLLGHSDPMLRDRYGYEIFAAWSIATSSWRPPISSAFEVGSVRTRAAVSARRRTIARCDAPFRCSISRCSPPTI